VCEVKTALFSFPRKYTIIVTEHIYQTSCCSLRCGGSSCCSLWYLGSDLASNTHSWISGVVMNKKSVFLKVFTRLCVVLAFNPAAEVVSIPSLPPQQTSGNSNNQKTLEPGSLFSGERLPPKESSPSFWTNHKLFAVLKCAKTKWPEMIVSYPL